MPNLVIFGNGPIAEVAYQYFCDDSEYTVCGFTLDQEYIASNEYLGLPVVPFETIKERFPPYEYELFIALSYREMNRLRARKYDQAKELGYTLATYVSSKCSYLSKELPGDNCFILEDNTIQPFVKIGSNVTLWSGNHIGHHSKIDDHNFVSSHVVVSGQCVVDPFCFLGVNATVGHGVVLAQGTLLGAGAIVTKSTTENGVYLPAKGAMHNKTSDQLEL